MMRKSDKKREKCWREEEIKGTKPIEWMKGQSPQ